MHIKKINLIGFIIFTLILITACSRNNQDNYNTDTYDSTRNKDNGAYEPTINDLESQLNIALKSGGITPESYADITRKIEEFEQKGADKEQITKLRGMLSQLSVGGQDAQIETKQADVQKPTEEVIEVKTEEILKEDKQKNETQDIIRWRYMDEMWKPNGEPPECPEPFVFQSPVDLNLVTSILYPGQVRGSDFKPHGGFRTDGTTGPVEVRAPFEGYVWNVARFYDAAGIHYMFDIQHPCGMMYRLGHLGAVPQKFQDIVSKLPEPAFGDSRTTEVEPVFVEAGEIIATDTQESTGFDLGVYDLRKENEASKDPAFREAHKDEPYQAYHALCWLNYLPEDQQATVKNFPGGDGISGKNSAYC